MDLDAFLAVHSAQLAAAQAQASIAGSLTDTALRAARGQEEVIAARLGNVARLLDIRWDAAAHSSLVRARTAALRKVRELETESARVKDYAARLGRLLTGASQHAIRDAWIAFSYFSERHAPLYETLWTVPSEDAYLSSNWLHAERKVGKPVESRNAYMLLKWARVNSYFPREGTPAFDFLKDRIAGLAKAAAAQAATISADVAAAEKEALEIQKIDWSRLDEEAQVVQ